MMVHLAPDSPPSRLRGATTSLVAGSEVACERVSIVVMMVCCSVLSMTIYVWLIALHGVFRELWVTMRPAL
jgi:hypothetical protein